MRLARVLEVPRETRAFGHIWMDDIGFDHLTETQEPLLGRLLQEADDGGAKCSRQELSILSWSFVKLSRAQESVMTSEKNSGKKGVSFSLGEHSGIGQEHTKTRQ